MQEQGSNGTKVETYKIIKENGEVVSRKLLAKSRYTPISKEIKLGTKKKEVPTEDKKEETPPVSAQPESSGESIPTVSVTSDAGSKQNTVTSSAENVQ